MPRRSPARPQAGRRPLHPRPRALTPPTSRQAETDGPYTAAATRVASIPRRRPRARPTLRSARGPTRAHPTSTTRSAAAGHAGDTNAVPIAQDGHIAHVDATSSATTKDATARTVGVTGQDAQRTHCQDHAGASSRREWSVTRNGSARATVRTSRTTPTSVPAPNDSLLAGGSAKGPASEDSGKDRRRSGREVVGEPVERAVPTVFRRRFVVALASVAVEAVAGVRDSGRRRWSPASRGVWLRRSSTPSTGIICVVVAEQAEPRSLQRARFARRAARPFPDCCA